MEINEEKEEAVKKPRKRGLPKGRTNNPGGRPPGKPNKITADVREAIFKFVHKNAAGVQKDFNRLEDPKDRLNFWKDMVAYIVPKMQLMKSETKITSTGAEHLTDEELTSLTLKLVTGDGED